METLAFSELVEINPRIGIERGKEYPFIEMGIVEPERRYVKTYKNRIFKGSGAKFIVGDTLFARITPCLENGKIVQYQNADGQPGFGSTEFFVFRARPKISDAGFVYYLAKSDLIRKPAEKSMSGASGRQRADLKSIVDLEVPVPPLPTQRKIAAILSAYDDLIENNLRRIKILEEMAQNLYREWFVKFRFPGHEKARFVDSPLGRMPGGWEVNTVEKTFSILGGGTPSKKIHEYWDNGTINWYSPTDLTAAQSMFMERSGKRINEMGLKKSSAQLFPEFSVMMTSRATLGVISINTTTACTNQGFITCLPNKRFPLYTLYYWLTENVDLFINLGTGATFKEITKGVFKKIELVIPEQTIVTQFEDTIQPFARQILNLQKKNTLLRHTRDLLLPKLISGEIDVSKIAIQTDWLSKDRNDLRRYDFFQQISCLPFVDKIVLFGSRARGDHHDRSDIDLAVFCDQASDEEWQQVLDCLREDRIDTLLKVDCVRFERSNAALKEHIMIEGKVLYEKNRPTTIERPKNRKEPIKMSENKLANHLSNSQRCLQRLDDAISQPLDEDMFMLDAVVHRFNIAFELLMDTLLEYCVESDLLPKERVKEYELNARKLIELAFDCKLIDDDQTWIAIKDARNATAHEYDEQQALAHYNKIKSYLPHLQALFEKMNTIADDVAEDVSNSAKSPDADN